ncbi:MAG: FKBP-type peptidyl-prolyl cis-trans isomerase [Bacteroidia bacterium]|nr:FKBP-type peptidyl-prolyl cis-trans isomerase [Bacteroidia bacterium]
MRFKFAIFILLLSSCQWNSFEGYTNIGNNVYLKIISFTDGQRVPSDSDIVTYHMKVFNRSGHVLFSSPEIFPLGLTSSLENAGHGMVLLNALLRNLEEGDSASFMIANPELTLGEEMRMLSNDNGLRVDVRLVKVRTRREYEREMVKISEVGDVQENLLIARFIRERKWIPDTIANGLYMIRTRKGKGEFPVAGERVAIRYSGSFLGGEVFDRGTLEFTVGEQMQVIRGLEIAIGKLREKGKAKIIIPSYLAFGENGSSNGTVPPSTPVVYEIERITPKKEK